MTETAVIQGIPYRLDRFVICLESNLVEHAVCVATIINRSVNKNAKFGVYHGRCKWDRFDGGCVILNESSNDPIEHLGIQSIVNPKVKAFFQELNDQLWKAMIDMDEGPYPLTDFGAQLPVIRSGLPEIRATDACGPLLSALSRVWWLDLDIRKKGKPGPKKPLSKAA
jgi:hypothetical protein